MQALCNGAVLDLYSNTAVLVPTFGKGALQGKRELAGYFRKFLGQRPGLCGRIDTMITQRVGITTIYSGTYTFFWGRNKSAKARYTFVTGPSGIVNHHSSAVP
jgi:hypothetical protein